MVTRGGWLGLAVLLVSLSGCALEDVRLKPPTSGLKTPIPGGNQRQVIVAVPFADGRQITNRCGMQKGGYGNETANALCQGEPAQWIAAFLASELKAAEPVVGFWSTTVETDLNVKLVATSRTGLRAERTFFVKGELTSIIWPQGIFNDSLENGTRELLTKMVEAILDLMKQYPELGFGHHHPAVVAWRPEQGR